MAKHQSGPEPYDPKYIAEVRKKLQDDLWWASLTRWVCSSLGLIGVLYLLVSLSNLSPELSILLLLGCGLVGAIGTLWIHH